MSAAGRTGRTTATSRADADYTDPYAHTDLIASIRAGEPFNERRQIADSVLTAIMPTIRRETTEAPLVP